MISIFADGSSTGGSHRPGGYGWVIVKDGEVLGWGYGGAPETSNNMMEMEGACCGMEALLNLGLHMVGEAVELVSDSQYTLGIASKAYHASANLEQAARIQALAAQTQVRFRWVRGHNGNHWNEICDQLARQGKLEYTPEDQRKKETKKQQRRERRQKVRDAQRQSEGGVPEADPGAA